MELHIHIADASVLTDADRSLLAAIAGVAKPIDFPSQAERIAASKTVEEKPEEPAKPAAKPAPAKPAAKPAPAKPKPEPEPEEADEEETETSGPTLDDAIAKATELVGAGKASDVKAALEAVGAPKVSALKGDAIAAFLEALSA